MRLTTLGLARSAYLIVAALLTATLLPRLGVPATWMPDLVLIGVVATAVVRGPFRGAMVGLLAGWVVELIPPVGRPLGLTALVLMVAGALAGTFSRLVTPTWPRAMLALLASTAAVSAARLASAVVADGRADPREGATVLVATLVVGAWLLPLLLSVDRALVRRRLG